MGTPAAGRGVVTASDAGRWRLGYRPALDGLRVVAVLLVLANHLGVAGFQAGGTVGVTIFFVLSGFLITALLVSEHDATGRIDFRSFYARRAKRLLPAFAVVSVAALLIAYARGIIDPAGAWLASVGYVANFLRMSGADMDTFDHIWSLSIEEQFYILWPSAVAVMLPWSRGLVTVLLGVAAVAIIALRSLIWTPAEEYRIYFGTDLRADALVLGAALAMAGARVPRSAGLIGVSLIVLAMMQRDTPAALTYTALGAAALVPVAARGLPLLGWSPLVRIGRISYGLYLWHYPIILGLVALNPAAPWIVQAPVALALSLLAAEVSFRWIETPARNWRYTRPSTGLPPPTTMNPGLQWGLGP